MKNDLTLAREWLSSCDFDELATKSAFEQHAKSLSEEVWEAFDGDRAAIEDALSAMASFVRARKSAARPAVKRSAAKRRRAKAA